MKDINKQIIDFIIEYRLDKRISPSLQDIAEEFGISKQAMGKRIERLIRLGFITKFDGVARSWLITPKGYSWIGGGNNGI